VTILPEGQTFAVPITIIFTWPDADSDGRVDGTRFSEANLVVTKNNVAITGRCRNEPGCDMAANTFTFQVSSLSEFTLAVVHHAASVDVDPETLKLTSLGNFVTAYLEVPAPFSAYMVDPTSIRVVRVNGVNLANPIPIASVHDVSDHNRNGVPDLTVKFDRASLVRVLSPGTATITVDFELSGGPMFRGSDTVRVLQ